MINFLALILLTLTLTTAAFSRENPPDQNNVIVIYNTKSSYGNSIAMYYKKARNIPDRNIFSITCDTSEVIYRTYFENYILKPLRDSIDKRQDVKLSALFIVLTKGIPLKIVKDGYDKCSDDDQKYPIRTSLDSRLCYIFDITFRDSVAEEPFPNRRTTYSVFWGKYEYKNFKSFFYTMKTLDNDYDTLTYLVSRLDGYTLRDIYRMIDRSVNAVSIGRGGKFTLDDDPKPFEFLEVGIRTPTDRMEVARDSLIKLGQTVKYDSTQNAVTMLDGTVGYCSYGFNASNYETRFNKENRAPFLNGYGPGGDDNPKFSKGAVFCSYESWNAWSFYEDNPDKNICSGHNNLGHNLLADFIKAGGTVAVGYVYEPYTWGIAHEEVLFPAYVRGYTFIEAAYLSFYYYNWRTVVLGDPLCRINHSEF